MSTESTQTTLSSIAETVRKTVQKEVGKGQTVGPSVLTGMLNNAENAWAGHCQKTGIDRDTPTNSTPLPDDGSGEEYQRAAWCCLPSDQNRLNAVFVCKHGKVYPMQQQPSTQQASDASSQSTAKNAGGDDKAKKRKSSKPVRSRGQSAKK